MRKIREKMQSVITDILRLEKDKPEDYWRDIAKVPLFTKKPHRDYSEVNYDDIITLDIDTRNAQSRTPFNALVCASTGVGKTRFIKNIVKGFFKQGYKILIIEPKSTEMYNARKMGKGYKIAPGDKNERLPVVCYMPNYVKEYITKNMPEQERKVKFYSPNIKKMDYVEIWSSFGIPLKIASLLVDMINKNHTTLDYFINHLPGKARHSMTRNAVESSLESLKVSNFFGSKHQLPLEEEWEKGNIVVVSYMSKDGAMMNTDIGLILDHVRDIGIKESRQGLNNVSKKLIIFDDAFYYAGLSATMATKSTGAINLAIRNISNCQNNFRTWGIDTMFVVQSPDSNAIIPSLIDGCTTKFVSYVENPTALQGKLPYDAYQILTNTKPGFPRLYFEEESYLFQWLYVKGKTRWFTGFPFDCTVGHS